MGYSLYEIEALAYHFGLSYEQVLQTDFSKDELERAIASYDGPTSGGRKESIC